MSPELLYCQNLHIVPLQILRTEDLGKMMQIVNDKNIAHAFVTERHHAKSGFPVHPHTADSELTRTRWILSSVTLAARSASVGTNLTRFKTRVPTEIPAQRIPSSPAHGGFQEAWE
ncbi:hypothetical protein K438DRAFT_1767651 [Mycena galopus ATCC 62051]|nr:hypothetical protein K438DRAFT_1767651 [Mycena galopus ATCC 62051]